MKRRARGAVARTYMDATHRDARDIRSVSGQEDVVFVGTRSLIPLSTELNDDRPVPTGTVSVRLLRRDTGVPIGQFAATRDAVDQLRGLLAKPRQLGMSCAEEYPGVVGQLLVLLPPSELTGLLGDTDSGPEEAWRESLDDVPDLSAEAAAEPPAGGPSVSDLAAASAQQEGRDEQEDDRLAALHAGNVVRFEADRQHPESLQREAADLLREALERPLPPLSDRLIEELAHGASADG